MLSRRLSRRGWDVHLAANGRQALSSAKSSSYDVILMDMSLPELDGWSVTRMLRDEFGDTQVPVIALTAHAMSGDREKALDAGCTDFETKPVDFARLLAKMQALAGVA